MMPPRGVRIHNPPQAWPDMSLDMTWITMDGHIKDSQLWLQHIYIIYLYISISLGKLCEPTGCFFEMVQMWSWIPWFQSSLSWFNLLLASRLGRLLVSHLASGGGSNMCFFEKTTSKWVKWWFYFSPFFLCCCCCISFGFEWFWMFFFCGGALFSCVFFFVGKKIS